MLHDKSAKSTGNRSVYLEIEDIPIGTPCQMIRTIYFIGAHCANSGAYSLL